MNRNTRARQPPEKPDRNSEELVAENITATPTSPQSEKDYRIPLASGLIVGEAILAVVLAIPAAAGVSF